jgi:hypothetical protein
MHRLFFPMERPGRFLSNQFLSLAKGSVWRLQNSPSFTAWITMPDRKRPNKSNKLTDPKQAENCLRDKCDR